MLALGYGGGWGAVGGKNVGDDEEEGGVRAGKVWRWAMMRERQSRV